MKVLVIGCGASGMMAAITAARNGNEVTVFEHTNRIGKKILATGNGKCNFTNASILVENYNDNAKFLINSVFNEFDNNATLKFFEEIGIRAINRNGYYYPRSEQASSIVESLGYAMFKAGVKVIRECSIRKVTKKNVDYKSYMEALKTDSKDIDNNIGFEVKTDTGNFSFDKIILATGSNAAPKTGSDGSGYDIARMLGHKIVKPLPALCGLKCDGKWFEKIAGVRCNARVNLLVDEKEIKADTGELQLTDYGISGIPVFQISSEAVRSYDNGSDVSVSIDFYPEVDSIEMLIEEINKIIRFTPDKSIEEFLSGMFNRKLCSVFADICGFEKSGKCRSLMDEEIEELAEVIKAFEVKVTGFNTDNAQICSGGIDCNDIKGTMESRKCEGLYFAGEIVDVNGDCGGYNLQWAWSSGYVAGLLN